METKSHELCKAAAYLGILIVLIAVVFIEVSRGIFTDS
jgi:hypothetical protein